MHRVKGWRDSSEHSVSTDQGKLPNYTTRHIAAEVGRPRIRVERKSIRGGHLLERPPQTRAVDESL
eukprot:5755631-Pleurochrysis_carterae.AAC.1